MKGQTPHTSKTGRQMYDANFRVSDQLTSLVIQEISLLPQGIKTDYLKNEFLSKFVSSDTDPAEVRRQRAIAKWLATERENEATNVRLLQTLPEFLILPGVEWGAFIGFAREVIVDIIGDTVPIEALLGGFSGGASTSRSRTASYPAGKYVGQADITAAALPWFELALEDMPGWPRLLPPSVRIVEGNVLFTVPKTTLIDRVAAKEPDLNMYLQKGVGNYFRQCLKRVRIDLNDQSRNKKLARRGSLNGDLATVDLSSASDSVTYGLVELLLPECWFSLLADLRSPVTDIDGDLHANEMFSSMGNGFTFELESLLFYVLARTTARFTGRRGVISVYGDDIIIPSGMFHDLERVLDWCGFSVNADKSFHTGPFRESCGGHYHNGVDITPFYLREPISRLTDVIRLCNQIRRWSAADAGSVLDDELWPLWSFLAELVPNSVKGGRDYGSAQQLVTPGSSFKRLNAITRKIEVDATGGLVYWLNATWARSSCGEGLETSFRTVDTGRYRLDRVKGRDWYSIPEYLGEIYRS